MFRTIQAEHSLCTDVADFDREVEGALLNTQAWTRADSQPEL